MQAPDQHVLCNLCGNQDSELITQKGQFNIPIRVVICPKCGLMYLNPRWSKEQYMHFYAHDYDRYYRKHIYKQAGKKSNSSNPIIERLAHHNLLPKQPVNILDVGSGEGDNLDDLEAKFPDSQLWAIEPSTQSQHLLKEKGYQILSDDAESDWEKECATKFDMIIMRHVLEHFMDPSGLLKKIHGILSETGVCYIAVPNAYKPKSPLQSYWFRVVHTYYFNKDTLSALLKKAGLRATVVIEGDSSNAFELVIIAKKDGNTAPSELPNVYSKQKQAVTSILEKENGLAEKLFRRPLRKCKKLLAKMLGK